jgi:hypothetical protein
MGGSSPVPIPEIAYCQTRHDLLHSVAEAVTELASLLNEQLMAIIKGESDFTRFDRRIKAATAKKEERKRALTEHVLELALVGYTEQCRQIENAIAAIRSQLGVRSTKAAASVTSDGARPKRQMSAAARKRIADAQRKRWAAFHKGKEAAAVPESRRQNAG